MSPTRHHIIKNTVRVGKELRFWPETNPTLVNFYRTLILLLRRSFALFFKSNPPVQTCNLYRPVPQRHLLMVIATFLNFFQIVRTANFVLFGSFFQATHSSKRPYRDTDIITTWYTYLMLNSFLFILKICSIHIHIYNSETTIAIIQFNFYTK